ncbi:hypothetical protein AAF712_008763 [Marasmius tenuissimus]|uniref:BZIP domain-containing protein n=1 Tax=Marasmius tenuissimus TaxID=585030 RepID=A0ABR2ZVI4_9AGAR|nr:hypothetical protein PM082_017951 [Marasmius tenuissimus]
MDSASIQTPSSISTPNNNRRRKHENETPSQRIKREKAAERQRRKRERDRNALHALSAAQVNQKDFQQQHQQVDHNQGLSSSSQQIQPGEYEDLTPEEANRRERVRAAARERQRKHRALVKQRKLRELGMDMGNQIVPNIDGLAYPDQSYGLPPSEIQPPPNSVDPQTGEPAFPRIQGHGGQMFATTLLLSFSCAPLLKQHLLDTLQMSNEELASLEPIIANAWDEWDRQRRQFDPQQHFDQNASSASSTTTTNSTTSTSTSAPSFPQLGPGASASETAAAAIAAVVTPDFRARFHRSIVAPSPFQAQAAAAAAQAGVTNGSSTPVIDPHLNEKDVKA